MIDIILMKKIRLFLNACTYVGSGGLEKLRKDASILLREINKSREYL